MITNSKLEVGRSFKILILIPVGLLLLFGAACIKGGNKSDTVTAVQLVKMNVLYLGVQNPVKIAVSGYETEDVTVSIDKGSISGANGAYMVLPKEQGVAIITISCKGKEIQQIQFRVKMLPDPVSAIILVSDNGSHSVSNGTISKKELLNAGGICADMKNFDFDLSFRVVSFDLSVILRGFTMTENSNSDRFTDKQIQLINQVKEERITFDNIKAVGPDGSERTLNSMVFKIEE